MHIEQVLHVKNKIKQPWKIMTWEPLNTSDEAKSWRRQLKQCYGLSEDCLLHLLAFLETQLFLESNNYDLQLVQINIRAAPIRILILVTLKQNFSHTLELILNPTVLSENNQNHLFPEAEASLTHSLLFSRNLEIHLD